MTTTNQRQIYQPSGDDRRGAAGVQPGDAPAFGEREHGEPVDDALAGLAEAGALDNDRYAPLGS